MKKLFIFNILLAYSLSISVFSTKQMPVETNELFFSTPGNLQQRLNNMSDEERAEYFIQGLNYFVYNHTHEATLNEKIDYKNLVDTAILTYFNSDKLKQKERFNQFKIFAYLLTDKKLAEKIFSQDPQKIRPVTGANDLIFPVMDILNSILLSLGLLTTDQHEKEVITDRIDKIKTLYLGRLSGDKINKNLINELTSESKRGVKNIFWNFFEKLFKNKSLQGLNFARFDKLTRLPKSAAVELFSDDNEETNYRIICNSDGFISESKCFDDAKGMIKGNPINIEGVKTGYNIHFPRKLATKPALIVKVYGGFGKEFKDKDFLPGVLEPLEKELLKAGMIVVSLNLPDRLELEVSQAEMPERLYEKLQKSINNFYQLVSNRPTDLLTENQPELTEWKALLGELKTADKFIIGRSFGGGVAVRHIQLYPNTFTGAISGDGSLYSSQDNIRKYGGDYMLPGDHIRDIDNNQRVLVLQNIDDARVIPRTGTNFYHNAQSEKPFNNIYLHIVPKSNPCTIMCHSFSEGDLTLKGHFYPTEPAIFKNLMQNIMVFINGGEGLKLLKENSEIFYNFYTNFIEQKPELINFYIGCIKDMMKNDLTDNEQEQSCLARFNIATLFSNLKSQKSDQESEFFTVLKQHSDELNNNKYFLLSSSDKLVWKVLNDLFFLDATKEDKEKIKNMILDKIFIKNKLDYFLRIFNESNTYNEFSKKLDKNTLFFLRP